MDDENEPKSIEDIKKIVSIYLNDEDRMVSSIYSTYIRPFCQLGVSAKSFIENNENLAELPANMVKIRRTLFKVCLLLDSFSEDGLPDPLPKEQFQQILKMIQMISPLAMTLNESTLINFINELKIVHDSCYPITIEKYRSILGLALKEPKFTILDESENNIHRKHYDDAMHENRKEKEKKPPIVVPGGYGILPHQKSFINRSVHLRLHRSKIKNGPSSKAAPLSSKH